MIMMQKIVYMLSDVEQATHKGLPRSEVVQRYLDDMEHELSSVEQLEDETVLVEKVLGKLVKERYLLELRGDGMREGEEGEDGMEEDEDDPILSVHPDCNLGS